jgi:hypothetical protein
MTVSETMMLTLLISGSLSLYLILRAAIDLLRQTPRQPSRSSD